jgi:hypothetical protein
MKDTRPTEEGKEADRARVKEEARTRSEESERDHHARRPSLDAIWPFRWFIRQYWRC